MADVKISQLPAATSPQAGDVAPMVSGGITVKTTSAQMVTAALNADPVAVTQGGTGATTAAGAQSNLGLGSMAVQDSNNVTITNGTIDDTVIGGSAQASGAFTSLSASGTVAGNGFTNYLASPPAIGGTAPNAVKSTTLTATGAVNLSPAAAGVIISPPSTISGTVVIDPAAGGNMDNVVIGFTTPTAGRFSAISTTTGQINTTPSNANDIANKAYVDSVAQGLDVKAPVQCATVTTLPANTYNNGTGGIGATLTASAAGVLTIDGYTPALGARILVKNEATQANNGIYSVTTLGTVSVGYVLTRTTDADTWNQLLQAFTFVENGTINANTGWVSQTTSGGTIGSTPITFVQFSGAGTYTAGTGLSLSGNQFSISTTTVTAGSYGSASSVPTFTVNAEGQLTAASNTSIAIANTAVSGLGTMSTQAASSVDVTGGTIDGTSVGATTPAAGAFTTLSSSSKTTLGATSATSLDNTPIGATIPAAGTFSELSSYDVALSGGFIDGVVIGTTTPESGTFTSIAATSGTVTNSPVSTTDIANKAYVDSVAVGLQVKSPAVVTTIAALPANTYNNGTAGVGATLTATADGALVVNGVTLTVGERILVQNESTLANNGIYSVTATGSVSAPYVLTRTTDADTWDLLIGAYVFVTGGTVFANVGWACQAAAGGTIGTSPVVFAEFSSAPTYTAGTGLTLTGAQFSITDTAVTAGTYGSASQYNRFSINAQGQVTAASAGDVAITLSQVTDAGTIASQNANSVDITGGSIDGTPLGSTTASSGAFTTLSASGTVSGTGFANYLASPPAIGSSTAAAGNFTSLSASSSLITNNAQVSLKGLTSGNTLQLSGAGATGNPELIWSVNDAGSQVTANITSVGGASTATSLRFAGNGNTLWTMDVQGDWFPTAGTQAMTSGFNFLPAAGGPPAGTPIVTNTGVAPMYYDTASDEFFVYNNVNAAWNSVALGAQVGMFRANSASITNATDTVILLQNQDTLIGNNITYNGGTGAFTNNADDTIYVQVNYTVAWDDISSAGNRAQWIAVNGDGGTSRYGMTDINASGADYDIFSGSAIIALTSGSYFQLYCWQNSGAALGQGGASGGNAANYSTKLQFTVL